MSEHRTTLKELIQDIDFRLSHLEDITADNRKIMIKLVKQGNTIVDFLKQFDVIFDFFFAAVRRRADFFVNLPKPLKKHCA